MTPRTSQVTGTRPMNLQSSQWLNAIVAPIFMVPTPETRKLSIGKILQTDVAQEPIGEREIPALIVQQ